MHIDSLKKIPFSKREELNGVISTIIEKASDPTGIKQLDRLQVDYFRYLLKTWKDESEKAITAALALIPDDNRSFSKSDNKKLMDSLESDLSEGFVKRVSSRTKKSITDYYQASKQVFHKRFSFDKKSKSLNFSTYSISTYGEVSVSKRLVETFVRKEEAEAVARSGAISGVSFSVIDKRITEQLGRITLLSIGDHFPKTLKPQVSALIQEAVIDRGLPRKQAGEFLREKLTEKFGVNITPESIKTPDQTRNYFEGLADTNMAFARNMSNMVAMSDVGIEKYVWQSVVDQTTTPICLQLNGQIFEVPTGIKFVDKVANVETVDELKTVMPFHKDLSEIGVGRGERANSAKMNESLKAHGIQIPPLHFRCRSEIHPF